MIQQPVDPLFHLSRFQGSVYEWAVVTASITVLSDMEAETHRSTASKQLLRVKKTRAQYLRPFCAKRAELRSFMRTPMGPEPKKQARPSGVDPYGKLLFTAARSCFQAACLPAPLPGDVFSPLQPGHAPQPFLKVV